MVVAAQGVARGIVCKGARVIAGPVVEFAQSEMKRSLDRGGRLGVEQLRLQAFDRLRRRAVSHGQLDIDRDQPVRQQLAVQGRPRDGFHLLETAELFQGVGFAGQGLGMVRTIFEDGLVSRQCRGHLLTAGQGRRQIEPRRKEGRFLVQRLAKQRLRLDQPVLLKAQPAEVVLGFGIVRLQRQGARESLLRVAEPAGRNQRQTQPVMGRRVIRGQADRRFETLGSGLHPLSDHAGGAQAVVRRRRAGRQPAGAGETVLGGRRIASMEEQVAEVQPGIGVVAGQRGRLPIGRDRAIRRAAGLMGEGEIVVMLRIGRFDLDGAHQPVDRVARTAALCGDDAEQAAGLRAARIAAQSCPAEPFGLVELAALMACERMPQDLIDIAVAGAAHGKATGPLRRGRLGDQAIAAGLRDQDLGVRGIALDLLAQAVDVGFQGVGGDRGVVAPDLAQQGVAAHDLVPGPIEVLQDRRFLFGQADLLAWISPWTSSLALGRKV